MSWLEDTFNAITGVSQAQAIANQQQNQAELQQTYFENQLGLATLNAQLTKERTKQITYIIIGIVVIVIILKVFKVF